MEESNLQFVEKTTYGLQIYVSQRGSDGYDSVLFVDMICHIMEVLSKWTGQTWIGRKKDKKTEKVFQNFFEALNSLIGYINLFEKMMSDEEKEFAMLATYNGVLYRYMGSGNLGNKECVEIEYNGVYVSWSKNEQNSYIENKLYGPWLRIKAQTLPFDYAIDLEGIDKFYQIITGDDNRVVRGNEREVVYPAIKDSVLEVTYKQAKKSIAN